MPDSTNTRRLQKGDRIRLVVLGVEMNDGKTVTASLRIPWMGYSPDHSCEADVCDSCVSQAQAKAIIKANKGSRSKAIQPTGAVTLLRDGQSVSF